MADNNKEENKPVKCGADSTINESSEDFDENDLPMFLTLEETEAILAEAAGAVNPEQYGTNIEMLLFGGGDNLDRLMEACETIQDFDESLLNDNENNVSLPGESSNVLQSMYVSSVNVVNAVDNSPTDETGGSGNHENKTETTVNQETDFGLNASQQLSNILHECQKLNNDEEEADNVENTARALTRIGNLVKKVGPAYKETMATAGPLGENDTLPSVDLSFLDLENVPTSSPLPSFSEQASEIDEIDLEILNEMINNES